ncbi:MAG: hypothetical protein ABIU05_05550 [Nitrospirales bacterium]
MMTAILPDTDTPNKPFNSDSDLQELPEKHPGSIILRFTTRGVDSVEILTDQSDEEDALRQRLAMARPMLEVLRKMFTLPQFRPSDCE